MSILRFRSARNKKTNQKKAPVARKTAAAASKQAPAVKPVAKAVVAKTPLVGKKTIKVARKPKKARFRIPYPYFHLTVAVLLSLVILTGSIFSAQKLVSLSREIEEDRGQMVALTEHGTSLTKLARDLSSLEGEAVVISQVLPNEEGIIDFVRQLKSLSQGVSLGVFNFGSDQPEIDEDGNHFIDFSAELEGNLVSLNQFLAGLLEMPYLIKLRVADISQADEATSQMVVSARIYVSEVFFKIDEKGN